MHTQSLVVLGENYSGYLPRRGAAGLQVVNFMFEEVLGSTQNVCAVCIPTCSTEGGLFPALLPTLGMVLPSKSFHEKCL